MRKNTAGQIVGAQMVSAADGSAFTGAVTCYITGDGGTQAVGSVGSGACTHEGNGFHTYAPAQAETNYDHVGYTFTGSGAVPVTVQVYTRRLSAANEDRLNAGAAGLVTGEVSGSGSTTTSIDTDLAEATADHYNGGVLIFISGALAGQKKGITDYDGSGTLTTTAFTEAPGDGDLFVIV